MTEYSILSHSLGTYTQYSMVCCVIQMELEWTQEAVESLSEQLVRARASINPRVYSHNNTPNTHTHTLSYTHTDSSYTDPLGDTPQRPRTAARVRPPDEDDFEGVELGDDLLPE